MKCYLRRLEKIIFFYNGSRGRKPYSSRLLYGKFSCMTSILRVGDVEGNESHFTEFTHQGFIL